MIKEAIGTGATIEEAKEQAVAILGASVEDNIEIEVLAMPKRKTLGLFGGSPAKVRVSMEVPDPKPAPKKPAPKPDRAKPAQRPAAQSAQKKPAAERKNDPAPIREDNPQKQAQRKSSPASERPARAKSETVEAKSSPKAPAFSAAGPAVPAAEVEAGSPAGRAVAYLQKLFTIMGLNEVQMTVSPVEGGSQIDLTGDGLGVIIGRRGETLDALQYLASLAANSGEGGFYRLVLNTGNYRQKREQTLQSLARRMAGQVLRTGRNRTLEPMNPYERRIIHTTVQSIEGVVSNSVGDGAARRVVISPDRECGSFDTGRTHQYGDAPRSRGGRPGFRDYREKSSASQRTELQSEAQRQEEKKEQPRRNRSEIEAFEAKAAGKAVILPENPVPSPAAAEPETAPAPAKKDVGDAPLYGRIDKKSE